MECLSLSFNVREFRFGSIQNYALLRFHIYILSMRQSRFPMSDTVVNIDPLTQFVLDWMMIWAHPLEQQYYPIRMLNFLK